MRAVRIGFMPLVDYALIAVAHGLGLAERRGIRLVPSREPSWAAIRDKVAFGLLDVAHMLAPVDAGARRQCHYRFREPSCRDGCGRSTGHGRSARSLRPSTGTGGSGASGLATPLRFASVFPFSTHAYELRS